MTEPISKTIQINKMSLYDDIFNADKIYDIAFNFIPRHPNGTKFRWSAGILCYSKLRQLKNGHGQYMMELSSDLKNMTMIGIELRFDRTDDEIHLIVIEPENDNTIS